MKTIKNPVDGRHFEDFAVGDVYRHYRGKTVKENDAVVICNMVMNTAQGHFNDHMMASTPVGTSLVYGGVTLSMIIGLASQDTAENCIRELGLDNIKMTSPVVHGDTLYAYTEVLNKEDHPEGGVLYLRHYGVNQDDVQVFQGDRSLLVKKRNA